MKKCDICGKKMLAGMTNDSGDFHVHEGACFETYMDKTYGKHKWMQLGGGEEDEEGGYYIYSEDVAGGYQGTGIYYTEWEDDEEDTTEVLYEYKDFIVKFIKHLDYICEREGTTVARKYHIDKGLVSNIRTGRRVPRPEFFEKHFGLDFPKHKIMISVEEEL